MCGESHVSHLWLKQSKTMLITARIYQWKFVSHGISAPYFKQSALTLDLSQNLDRMDSLIRGLACPGKHEKIQGGCSKMQHHPSQ